MYQSLHCYRRMAGVAAYVACMLAALPASPTGAATQAHRLASSRVPAPMTVVPGGHVIPQTVGLTATASMTACAPWQLAAGAPFSSTTSLLNGISAASAGDIWTVGYSGTPAGGPFHEIIEHWDGTRWHVVPGANARLDSRLYGVAAIAPGDVWSIGSTGIAHWDGTRWRDVASPSVGRLNGIAAVSSRDIWVVGSNTIGTQTVTEHWNGMHWRIVPSPNPGVGGALQGVAAVSSDDVWAVGSVARGYRDTLVEHWDGARWRIIPSPTGPSGSSSALNAVTAISAHDVWAVGGYDAAPDPSGALIEHWDGARWRLVANPATDALNDVAAVSARDIWAVGSAIEHWDGARWSSVPNPTGAVFYAVAAVAADDLWAAGSTQPPDGSLALDHYGGGLCYISKPGVTPLPASTGASPLAVDGTTHRAFVASGDGTLKVFDTTDGVLLRRVVVGRMTGATLDERHGRLFLLLASGIAILDAASGAVLRTVPLSAPGHVIAFDEQRTRLFVAAGTAIDVFDTARGALLDTITLPAAPALIALDERRGHLLLVAPYRVTTLDVATGRVLQRAPSGPHPSSLWLDQSQARLAVVDDVCCQGPATVALYDTSSGALLRSIGVASYYTLVGDEKAGRFAVTTWGTPSNNDQGAVLLYDALTGALVRTLPWRDDLGPPVLAADDQNGDIYSATISQLTGTVTVLMPPGPVTVTVLDGASGATLRTIDAGTNPDASNLWLVPDGSAHRLFVVWRAPASQVSVINTASGAVVNTLPVGFSPSAVLLDARRNRLFVACLINTNQYGEPTGPGAIYAIDATDGHVLATLPTPIDPEAMTIDENTGEVFVDGGGVYQNSRAPASLSVFNADLGGIVRPAPVLPTALAAPHPGDRYFPNSGHNLGGAFLAFWQQYGGLTTFGYPRTEAFVDDARWVQYTDRFLLAKVNGQIQTAPLGRLLTLGRAFPAIKPFAATANRLYVAATGHSLSGRFLAWWRAHNGAVLLGQPVSEVIVEGNGDGSGRRYPLQWFENGRLEYHPELAGTRYAMELGLLGVQALRQKGWLP